MSKTLAIIASIALFVATSASAVELTNEQRDIVRHLAYTSAIQDYCKIYKTNDDVYTKLAIKSRINFHDTQTSALFQNLYKRYIDNFDTVGEARGCAKAWSLYGEGGEEIFNLLLRR